MLHNSPQKAFLRRLGLRRAHGGVKMQQDALVAARPQSVKVTSSQGSPMALPITVHRMGGSTRVLLGTARGSVDGLLIVGFPINKFYAPSPAQTSRAMFSEKLG